MSDKKSIYATLSQKRLKELLEYNPLTGVFTRIVTIHTANNSATVGTVAGWVTRERYVKISIDKKVYSAHRLVFLYMYGALPKNEVDHINHIRNDNRLCNLIDATYSSNNKNASKRKDNTSGVVGVSWYKRNKKWGAIINVDKKPIFLGLFIEFHEAVNARKNAEVLYGFHKNHGKDM